MVVTCESLPDIMPLVVSMLSVSQANDTSPCVQFLRQCVPLKRRTKRAQRDIHWTQQSAPTMQIFLRCAMGTLLGLYPTCCKSVDFHNRVALNSLTHTLLVGPPSLLTEFFNAVSYTLRLCVMEYCCFCIQTYAPGLVVALNKKKQFHVFCKAIHGVCDVYRSDLNLSNLDAAHADRTWAQLRKLEISAQTLFDRCSRAFRTVITSTAHCGLSGAMRRSISQKILKQPGFVDECMQMHMCPNKYVFATVNAGPDAAAAGASATDLEHHWELQNNVRIRTLTTQIALKQIAKVHALHPQDSALRARQYMTQICATCALKPGYEHRRCATRFNTVTRRLTCIDCKTQSVLQVNLVGRVMYIGASPIVLSLCCAAPILWKGSGHEWSETCGPHCSQLAFQGAHIIVTSSRSLLLRENRSLLPLPLTQVLLLVGAPKAAWRALPNRSKSATSALPAASWTLPECSTCAGAICAACVRVVAYMHIHIHANTRALPK